MATVDVFVPCYNYGRFLRECVESILTQEGVAVRVLILDDCSTDESSDVGLALAAADPRVEYRRHDVNRGHIATYNEGIDWAAGDYTMLLSADDMLTQGAFLRAVRVMEAHPEVGFVYGRHIRFINRRDIIVEPGQYTPRIEIRTGPRWLERICELGFNPIACPEVLARTALQKEVGGYTVELPHTGDMEMWMRYAARTSVGFIDCIQAYYRVHGGNMSSTLAPGMADQLDPCWKAFCFFFERDGDLVPDARRLRRLAGNTIAQETLSYAYNFACSEEPARARLLLSMAQEICPASQWRRLYISTRLRLILGPRLATKLGRLWRWIRFKVNLPKIGGR